MNRSESKPGSSKVQMPAGPLPQHKRLAAGEKVDGMSNPNGAPVPAKKLIGNAPVTY